jgi:hypothetical protein
VGTFVLAIDISLEELIRFYKIYPDFQIVASLLRQLSWTHFTLLIPIKDELQRDFVALMYRIEKWSVRTLRQKIDTMLFERTYKPKVFSG